MSFSKEVRIISGQYKGRKLKINDTGVKPTPDRVRETLFNWLEPIVHDSSILDLFAGSGVLGIEALSRGGKHLTLIDSSPNVHQSLEQQIENIGICNYRNLCMDAFKFIGSKNKKSSFDIIFIDPPYGSYDLIEIITLLYENNWASKTTTVYYETNQLITTEGQFGCYIYKESRAGKVYYGLIRQIDSD